MPTVRTFERLLIVNRGEAAMRAIHAARELSFERGRKLRAVVLYTDPDRQALFVREADEAFPLGPATFVDADGHRQSRYLDLDLLESALVQTRADAAWPGWGFVAERPDFAALCERLGVAFVGPPSEVMRRLGDKITSKRLAEEAGIPTVPWSGGPVPTLKEAEAAARQLGWPLLIKATAGGGGRGIRIVRSAAELEEALASARAEAKRAFGNGDVFLEQLIAGPRHVEVQVIADAHGATWAVGVRDCSIQRRNQKVIEESGSPALRADEQEALKDAAVRLCRRAGYVGAGTIEFLFDPATRAYHFMEANARLQVEHPVTEMTTGLDLVKMQIVVAEGGRLEGEPPPARGHAIEARLNAEDPENEFCPAPGTVQRLRFPLGPGLRVDTGVAEGDEIPAAFDSMIAKVVAWGQDRAEALARLQRALAQSAVVIRPGVCNKAFLLELLGRPEVRDGTADVRWLDHLVARAEHVSARQAGLALLRALIEGYESDLEIERAQFYSAAARGRPRVEDRVGRRVELRHAGHQYAADVYRRDRDRYRMDFGGSSLDVRVEWRGTYPLRDRRGQGSEWRLRCGGESYRTFAVVQGLTCVVEIDGVPHRFHRDRQGIVRAPSPAVVVSVAVKEGDTVAAGDRLLVLEAMKMESSILAGFAGVVRAVHAIPNMQVDTGAPLVLIEPEASGAVSAAMPRLDLEGLAGDADDPAPRPGWRRQDLDDLRRRLLGFDGTASEVAGLAARAAQTAEADPATMRDEADVLGIFADLGALFRRHPMPLDALNGVDDVRRTAQEYLFTYLRDVDGRGAGLPSDFLLRLQRALAHYGVASLERSADLEESLFRIYRAHQRETELVPLVLALLERLLLAAEGPGPAMGEEVRRVLDHLVVEAEHRHPSVAELAREVRYRAFERPLLDAARARVFAQADADLDALGTTEPGPQRDAHVVSLVESPQALAGMIVERLRPATPVARAAMLEVLVRRYYRIRALHSLAYREIEGHGFATAEYEHAGTRQTVLATQAAETDLPAALAAAARAVAEVPPDREVRLDVFLRRTGGPDDVAVAAERLRVAVNAVPFPRRVARLTVAVAATEDRPHALQLFTFRPGPEGYVEDLFYRGAHPMLAERLGLERLANFEIERLPSSDDLYVIKAVAKENPRDERLVVVAEVRDLTPVRDASGQIAELPALERTLLEALAAIRSLQMRRPPDRRGAWNSVVLHLGPPVDLRSEDMARLVSRLAPATEGLGLDTVMLYGRIEEGPGQPARERTLVVTKPAGRGIVLTLRPPVRGRVPALSPYEQKVARLRARGLVYPYELVKMLAPPRGRRAGFVPGEFVEYDLEGDELVPVHRPPGQNEANVVVGVIRNFTPVHPEGMARVILLGDPSRDLGALAEPECRRIVAAMDLAEGMRVPVEWFALSAGARISMESGTENLDWIGAALRRIVTFTQAGGEINVVVNGINVGAQPYWNAEATMLMHTRGILVMMPESAMVLTGKRALEYSGGISAEDNQGIGGFDRIMGPNGQAQYFARDLSEAGQILLRHYEHSYVAPGERFPRRAPTSDPVDRDVCAFPYHHADGAGFATVGDVFSDAKNPGRKKPFDIRTVMAAVVDQDRPPFERWFAWQDAETAVVWDAHLGGHPACVIGLESRPLPRLGFVPADGPDAWTSGTLFPQSSRKVARALNASSGVRPVVVLANFTGFDGSPESMRLWQLEYGAEIGRAVVNFRGPIVFCVISRYHGGAFVVFSNALNDGLEVAALEGTYASVIGGAPAAAVVFAREVERRVGEDLRIKALEAEIAGAQGAERARLRARLAEVRPSVQSEKLGEVAEEFDAVHSVERARRVGSVHRILPPSRLRPYLVDALERGMRATLEREGQAAFAVH